ncbi:MAG TPA: type II toxin-antitoxin system RelE/ParE family toxin [Thermoguttaceae bacterium]
MARLIISPDAECDLVEIGVYIARHSGSRERAKHFLSSLRQTCETLASQPEMGQIRTEFVTGQYRSFSVGNYVIYFSSIPDGIEIARILHGARDHDALL